MQNETEFGSAEPSNINVINFQDGVPQEAILAQGSPGYQQSDGDTMQNSATVSPAAGQKIAVKSGKDNLA